MFSRVAMIAIGALMAYFCGKSVPIFYRKNITNPSNPRMFEDYTNPIDFITEFVFNIYGEVVFLAVMTAVGVFFIILGIWGL